VEGRNEIQLLQLQTDQLQDIKSGLKYLRGLHNADKNHIVVMGHSFGGSLALLVAESFLRTIIMNTTQHVLFI
jgi:acetyl esterase/lipase